jgi:predicted double-glycine peptidase
MIAPCFAIALAFLVTVTDDGPSADEVVRLEDYAPCGPVSLYLVTQMRGVPVEWGQLLELVGPAKSDRTHSFDDLAKAATQLGMHPVGLNASREALATLPMPAIVELHDRDKPNEPHHLLVLVGAQADGVMLLDAPYPAYFLPDANFRKVWTGNVLVFARSAEEASSILTPHQTRRAVTMALWILGGAGGIVLLSLGVWNWLRARRATGRPALISRESLTRPWARIPRWLTVSSLAALVLALGAAAFFASGLFLRAATPPQCVFDTPVIELGVLAPGARVIPVTITNPGNAPLHISAVHSTCTCAVPKYPERIEPGQSAVLDVELSVTPGPRGARISVESNDPQGEKHVALSWHGIARPRLAPGQITEPAANGAHVFERTIKLIYPGGKNAIVPRIDRLECDSPRVQIREGRNDPLAIRLASSGLLVDVMGELDLHVTVQPPAEPESFQAVARLTFKYGADSALFHIPIEVRFTGAELAPDVNTVAFSAGSGGELKGQERVVRVAERKPGGDLVVTDAPPWLDCQCLERSAEGSLLRFRITEEPMPSSGQHTVHIARRDDPQARVALRVSVFAPGP